MNLGLLLFFTSALAATIPLYMDQTITLNVTDPNIAITAEYGLMNVSIANETYCTYATDCDIYRRCNKIPIEINISAVYSENAESIIISYSTTDNCGVDIATDIMVIILVFALIGILSFGLAACYVWLRRKTRPPFY